MLLILLLVHFFSHAQTVKGSALEADSEEAREFKEYREFKRLKKTKPARAKTPAAAVSETERAPAQRSLNLSIVERDILSKGEISTGQYIAGGIVGTVLGLGIGHAIQGRYRESGWIFTAGELMAASLYVSGVSDCTSIYSGTSYTCGKNLTTTGSIGGVALLGLRIWEIIDLWPSLSVLKA